MMVLRPARAVIVSSGENAAEKAAFMVTCSPFGRTRMALLVSRRRMSSAPTATSLPFREVLAQDPGSALTATGLTSNLAESRRTTLPSSPVTANQELLRVDFKHRIVPL